MWRFALSVGFFFGIVVGIVGYGRVLPVYLLVRVLVVTLGTITTIVAATKFVDTLVGQQQTGASSPQVKEVNLGNLDNPGDQAESGELTETGNEGAGEESTPEIDTSTDLEEDAEIEELADMVSETMTDDETES